MTRILLISDPVDGNFVQRIRDVLKDVDAKWDSQPAALPELWEEVVILFAMTSLSVNNAGLTQFVEDAIQRALPVVPIVEDLATFSFRQIPATLTGLKKLNSLDVTPTGEERLINAVRGYLGMYSFARHRKVFLSYKRSDGEQAATSIRDYLKGKGFQVFHDIETLEGGESVQDRITEEIPKMDFVLLIESPTVGQSDWVEKEIVEAQSRRIPVRVVKLAGAKPYFVPDAQRVEWDPQISNNLERILLMVSRAIAERESLDSRVLRIARETASLRGASIDSSTQHSIVLKKGAAQFLVEYENAVASIERLHRLSENVKARANCQGALICSDSAIPPLTMNAASWACRNEPIELLALTDLMTAIVRCLP